MEATTVADAYAANCVYVEALEEIVQQLKEQEEKILARIQAIQSHEKAVRLAMMENMLGKSILLEQQKTTTRRKSKNKRQGPWGKQTKELTMASTARPLSYFSRPTEVWTDVDIYTSMDSVFFRNVRAKYPDPKVLLPSLSRKWDDQERLQLCRSVDFYLQHRHHHHHYRQQQQQTQPQQQQSPQQQKSPQPHEKESSSVRTALTMLDWAYIHQWHHSTKLQQQQPQRSIRSCAHRYALWQEEELEKKHPWTDAEDSALERAVIKHNHDWVQIASAMAAITTTTTATSKNVKHAVAIQNKDAGSGAHVAAKSTTRITRGRTKDAIFPERLPVSYLIRYQTKKIQAAIDSHTNVEWTEDEDNCLRDAVATMKSQHTSSHVNAPQNVFFWNRVVKLNKRLHGRTPNQCGARWRYALAPSIVHGNFSVEEDRRLLLAVVAFQEQHPHQDDHPSHHHRPHVDWMRVQTMLRHRTNVQCRERFQDVLDPFKNGHPFTADEDARLHQLVAVHGVGSWAKMAASFHGRTPAQLRQRWRIIGRRYTS